MPIYFNDIAPFCPVSRDQPVGPGSAPNIRSVIPHAHDLASAIAAVNIARTIITNLVFNKVINNVHTPPPLKGWPGGSFEKERHSKWREVPGTRVKHLYKYYAVDKNGEQDRNIWVMTERIEKMVWYDSAWKTKLVFSYGLKGEGESVDDNSDLNDEGGDGSDF